MTVHRASSDVPIRSGEHALWEAHIVRGRALADLTELAASFEPVHRAFVRIGVSAAQAVARMRQLDHSFHNPN